MKDKIRWFVVHYIMPVVGMLCLAPYFVEHFFYKENEYLLNYQIAYTIFLTCTTIGLGVIALVSLISKSAKYTAKQVDTMRKGKKKTFLGKYVYGPIHWILFAGIILTGHFYIAILILLTKPIVAIINNKQKKVISDYDKNIADQKNGNVPLEAEYQVIE